LGVLLLSRIYSNYTSGYTVKTIWEPFQVFIWPPFPFSFEGGDMEKVNRHDLRVSMSAIRGVIINVKPSRKVGKKSGKG